MPSTTMNNIYFIHPSICIDGKNMELKIYPNEKRRQITFIGYITDPSLEQVFKAQSVIVLHATLIVLGDTLIFTSHRYMVNIDISLY